MLDAMAPLSEVMEVFHSEAEEVSSELVAKAVEDAITLISNASSQISSLRRTQVLPLQDGGNSYPSRPAPPRGLDGKSGSEGCLFHHPHPPGPPEILEVHGGRNLLPVHLPPIRPVLRPVDLHQGDETISDLAEVMGVSG